MAKAIVVIKVEEKLEIAKKALKKGMLIPDIADITGLTEEKIRDIIF